MADPRKAVVKEGGAKKYFLPGSTEATFTPLRSGGEVLTWAAGSTIPDLDEATAGTYWQVPNGDGSWVAGNSPNYGSDFKYFYPTQFVEQQRKLYVDGDEINW